MDVNLPDQPMAADAMRRIIEDVVAPLLDDAGYEITKRDGTITDTHTPKESENPGQGGPGVPLTVTLTTCSGCTHSMFCPKNFAAVGGWYCFGPHAFGRSRLICEQGIAPTWPPIPQWCPIADKEKNHEPG